ncbi:MULTISPECIES: phage tail tape measure protein [Pseudomonas aeruginosa group]|uniref:phage tail tape measure protein n=1 Tax=Pseudomonas aeruginosa group TaxID=136841 RepID=UPI0006B2789F|nr:MULTISPECIES: phage tail tape measure C-terminal domain-containing protein [Pseudomonas aeruginosa group]KPD26774.1 phage tail tape measure protein [Pseudomonas paraeruginosa]KQB31069.1 phage tail tape measure protein [Pseudomonas paraeruginosa]MDT1023327.1 phage tail tape measure C-terminal domain-containing protein [Pseudomonas paraeruginosa]PHJ30199.1 phage tail tape measure protein [Pseudomonas paraeruginosa]QQV49334.1 phage tail tape measure protein [Pseudomonas aeruginosa]
MATNSNGSLTLDLVLRSEGYRAGMDKVGRINDRQMRAMEARAEKAGKAIGNSLGNSALIATSVLDQALDMLGKTTRQAEQAKKPAQKAQDKVLAEWKTRQKELGEAWKSYREPLQDLSKLNEALLKNSSDKLDKALLNLSETGKLSLANVGKTAYADAARLASRQMTLMLLDGLFGWVASVGTEKPKVDDKAGKGLAKAGDDEKEQPSLQSQVFKQWLLQMNGVWGAYRAPLQDISGMTDELFRNASEKLEKSLFNFATTGKLSLSNFAKTVIDDVARIAARQLSMLALDGLFGWLNDKAGITEAQLASQKPHTSLLEKARSDAGQAAAGVPAAQGAAPMPAATMDVGAMVATASGQTGDGSKASGADASVSAGKPVGSWVEQMDASWASLRDQAQDVSGMMDTLFTNAFTNMENALFTFATTGKLSFKDFADSVIQDMARIAARQATLQIIGGIVGAVSGFFGSGATAGSRISDYTGADMANWVSKQRAGGMPGFARGGAFNDGIQSAPALFSMAGGRPALIGERGPEAIMPLSRGSDGVLGVRALGGGEGGNVFNFSTSVSLGGGREGAATASGDDGTGQQLAGMINDAARNVVAQELRPGGLVWRMVNG